MTTVYPLDSVSAVSDALAAEGYLADRRIATTVFLLTQLEKPILLEGPAGVGKTELAKAVSAMTGRPLLRLQCYEGQDESKALYEWDYGKQLLYTQVLREKINDVVADAPDLDDAIERIGRRESAFFSERFLASRPLLDAVRSEEPVVLLIDEVDRADEALEAVLLETLAENQVSVPELGTFVARRPPYVILTSNNTRDLSAALKRRCLHLFLDYPSARRELDIVMSKDTGLPEGLTGQLVQVVRGLRDLELRKAPSISETIDWARTLAVLGMTELDASVLADTIAVVSKFDKDVARSLQALPRLVDPNATIPEDDHGHGHGHGHGYGHGHGVPSGSSPGRNGRSARIEEDDDTSGARLREARDRPGRHDNAGYTGPPGSSSDAVGPEQPKRRQAISRSAGASSFLRRRRDES